MRIMQFQKFRDANYIQPERVKINIPAFALSAAVWSGSSTLLAEFPLENTDYYFSIKLPVKSFGDNFVAAIRWVVDGVVYRFVFWDDSDAVLYYPVYAGERIGLNAVLEIWSLNTTSAPELDDVHTLYSSVLVFPESDSNCCCCSIPSGEIDLVMTAPSPLPPYAFCNPFCDGLC